MSVRASVLHIASGLFHHNYYSLSFCIFLNGQELKTNLINYIFLTFRVRVFKK